MRFQLSQQTRRAIDAVVGEWCGQVPPEMTARLTALSLDDCRQYLAAQKILTDLEAIAARPSIKGRRAR